MKVSDLFSADIEIRPVTDSDSPEFAQCIALYEMAFPEGERETRYAIRTWLTTALRGSLAPDDYHMLAAIDTAAESVCGVALFHYLGVIGCGFIGYLVVAPNRQNQGLGGKLLQTVPAVVERDAQRMGGMIPPWDY